jgi:type II secretory ATPase GspE/PulE/Tfp pilus assembly ATPase PilB-like protein
MIVAQRLLRKLCPDCKEAYEPRPEQLGGLKLKAELIYKPKGCPKCSQVGYRGRLCIAECMTANDKIRELINDRASFQKIREVSKASGMQTLYQSAIKKVEEGITSLEEALSVTLGAD